MKILIIEDQRRMGQFVEKALTEQNYAPRLVDNCSEARQAVNESPYGAIVLDLGLPDGDGLDLLRDWRSEGVDSPVLILSARDAVEDRIRGLNLGADDYLPKPFSVDELLARLRCIMRRSCPVKTTVLSHGPLCLDTAAHWVKREGARVHLTNREFSLLELFMQNPGRILTRTFITERVWEASCDLGTNLIDVYVRRLRDKLEDSPERPLLRTIRGSGYILA